MKKVIPKLCFIFLIGLILSGCRKASAVNDNGIVRAMNQGEKDSLKLTVSNNDEIIHGNNSESQADMPESVEEYETTETDTKEDIKETESELIQIPAGKPSETYQDISETEGQISVQNSEGHINDSIDSSKGSIIIDADVVGIDRTYVNTYDCVHVRYDEKTAMNMLEEFVGSELAGTFRQNFEWWEGGEDGSLALNIVNGFKLVTAYMCLSDNRYLGIHSDMVAPGCTMTVDECQMRAEEIMSKYVTGSYYFLGRKIFDQEHVGSGYTKTGRYEFYYKEQIDGMDIYEINNRSEKEVTIGMTDNTVIAINIDNYALTKTGTYSYISVEDAIKRIKEQIGLYDAFFIPGQIDRIEFEYVVPMCDVYEEAVTIEPSWLFYGKGGMSLSISVNAITGEVKVF